MLIESWSNHPDPIVHAKLPMGKVSTHIADTIRNFKDQGIFRRQAHGIGNSLVVTLSNGVTITYRIAIVRE
jgi:hypothetical protein